MNVEEMGRRDVGYLIIRRCLPYIHCRPLNPAFLLQCRDESIRQMWRTPYEYTSPTTNFALFWTGAGIHCECLGTNAINSPKHGMIGRDLEILMLSQNPQLLGRFSRLVFGGVRISRYGTSDPASGPRTENVAIIRLGRSASLHPEDSSSFFRFAWLRGFENGCCEENS